MRTKKLALSDNTLFLSGETGCGKSRLAKELHEISSRRDEKFIHVNLCNFSSSVFESELFGHSRGAFTGAYSDKRGFAEGVGKGSLFLDEVGDLPLETQSKLLMLLEEKVFYPVGSLSVKKFHGRLIFATNKDLEALAEKGLFRKDLFYRLKTFEIRLEPIRESESLADLIEKEFISAKSKTGNMNLVLGPELFDFLVSYNWPGNYRELKNVLEHICLLGEVTARLVDLPLYLTKEEKKAEDEATLLQSSYWKAMEAFEKTYLENRLRERSFRLNKTAREIGISKATLMSKIKKYDMKKKYKNFAQKDAV